MISSGKSAFPSEAFLEAARLTRPRMTPQKVYVYVEDDIDIVFWRRFFEASGIEYSFQFYVYKVSDKEIRGKDAIMKDVVNGSLPLSRFVLACLDSDLDLLIDNYHTYTDVFRKNPYIINTVWYAIENLKCAPKDVKRFIDMVTLSSVLKVDVPTKLSAVSQLVEEFFFVCLASYKNKDGYFSLDSLKSVLHKLAFNCQGDVEEASRSAIILEQKKHKTYVSSHITEFQGFKELLRSNYPDTSILCFFRGHDLVDEIVKPFILSVSSAIRGERLTEIGGSKVDASHKKQLCNQYANQTGTANGSLSGRIEGLIRDNYDFLSLPVSSSIIAQINKAVVSGVIADIVKGVSSSKA